MMIEAIVAYIGLFMAVKTKDPDWVMGAGLFAIAANLNLIYHKGE